MNKEKIKDFYNLAISKIDTAKILYEWLVDEYLYSECFVPVETNEECKNLNKIK